MLAVLALAGCGEDAGSPSAPESSPSAAAECGEVMVPGHEALGIRAGGVGCDVARTVAAAAEGRGRQPYDAEGFSCEPADAGDGDTNYTCTRRDAQVGFRYGTA